MILPLLKFSVSLAVLVLILRIYPGFFYMLLICKYRYFFQSLIRGPVSLTSPDPGGKLVTDLVGFGSCLDIFVAFEKKICWQNGGTNKY
jgi:hypothetical protein